MNAERLTLKAREALHAAHARAKEGGQPEVLPEHLLHALLVQADGVVPAVLGKTGSDVRDLTTLVAREIDRLPKVSGGSDPTLSRRLVDAVERAEKTASKGGEDYVSTEHLLLGIL